MKGVELYGRVRYAVQIEGLSHREAARQFGIDPRTVAKMVKFSVPPGYGRATILRLWLSATKRQPRRSHRMKQRACLLLNRFLQC